MGGLVSYSYSCGGPVRPAKKDPNKKSLQSMLKLSRVSAMKKNAGVSPGGKGMGMGF